MSKTTKEPIDPEVENFIKDWHWDNKQSHKYAQDLCKYLFQFIDSPDVQCLSEKTINKHIDNCWAIGFLECNYGYRKTFLPNKVFDSPEADYEYEFKRKMSDSEYAINSYRSTWRKLYKYTKEMGLLD